MHNKTTFGVLETVRVLILMQVYHQLLIVVSRVEEVVQVLLTALATCFFMPTQGLHYLVKQL